MSLHMTQFERIMTIYGGCDADASTVPIKRGEEIFAGTDYPREWSWFIGQEVAKRQLQVQIASAEKRGARLEHTLLASGTAGIGKSTLATLLAYKACVGLVHLTGPLTQEEFRRAVMGMRDRDVVFIDEIHLLTQGNRTRADWLLPWMTEGKLYTSSGAVQTPDVTLVGATTDAGKLPATLLSRFMVQPKLVEYTESEAALIVQNLAGRMGVDGLRGEEYARIARAAGHNPRVMRRILTTVRDLQCASPQETPNLALAFEWSGVSHDGLDTMAQDILLVLLASPKFTASSESIRAQLNEPGPLHHAERELLRRMLITISGRGRELTDAGRQRAIELVKERR